MSECNRNCDCVGECKAGHDKSEPLYGFWIYDLFPYTLSGVIDETKPLLDSNPNARYVPSYDRYFCMLATIRGAKGAKLKAELEAIRENRRKEDEATGKRFMANLSAMLKSAGVEHPTIKRVDERAKA